MQGDRPWYKSWPSYLEKEAKVPDAPAQSILSTSAQRRGGHVCLRYQGRSLSYAEVERLSNCFAAGLSSIGVSKGTRVAVFLPNIPQFVISYFGILKAGGIVVPCSPLYKERELEHQLKDSESAVVIAANDVVRGNDLFASLEGCRPRLSLSQVVTASVTDYLPGVKRRLARFAGVRKVERKDTTPFGELVAKGEGGALHPSSSADETAVLQYTGGTTGVSRGAMLSHRNVYSAAVIGAMSLPLAESDVSLAVLPLFHIFGMTACMNAPMVAGGEVVLLPRFDVVEVMRSIQRDAVTCFCGVPTMYVAVNNHPKVAEFKLKSVRVAFSGGAPLPVAVRKRFIELTGGNLVEGYGLTESAAVGTTNPFQGGMQKDGSIGFPFPSTDARIVALDDPRKVLETGEAGELAISGPQVMSGYWNGPDETAAALIDGWLLTGDVAKMDADGYFFIIDRKKDMIDVGGLKVYPREVEEVLYEHPYVKEAAVVGVPDPYMGETVKAFVVLKDPQTAKSAESEISSFCKERLSRHKAPRYYEFVPDLPKTLVGKVLRKALREKVSA